MTTTANKFDAMGKEELRAACRAAKLPYGKLTNAEMRAALTANAIEIAADEITIPANETATDTPSPGGINPFGGLMGKVAVPAFTGKSTKAVDGKVTEDKPVQAAATPRPRVERTPAPYVPPVVRKGYKIQKERPMQNGVKRPSEGTVCGAVWAAFDSTSASATGLSAADLPGIADANHWNRTNVSCEYYAWRKFNGIKAGSSK